MRDFFCAISEREKFVASKVCVCQCSACNIELQHEASSVCISSHFLSDQYVLHYTLVLHHNYQLISYFL